MNNASSSSFVESFQRNHPSHVDLNKTQVRLFFQRNFSLRCEQPSEQQKKIAKQKQSKIWKMNSLKRDNDRMTTVKWDELKKGAPKTRIAMRNISCIWELARCRFWFVEKISKSAHFPRANHPFVWHSENFFFCNRLSVSKESFPVSTIRETLFFHLSSALLHPLRVPILLLSVNANKMRVTQRRRRRRKRKGGEKRRRRWWWETSNANLHMFQLKIKCEKQGNALAT